MNIKLGSILKVEKNQFKVVGIITYKNTEDFGKRWTEYKLSGPGGIAWLSIDKVYKEYSISRALKGSKNFVTPKWHEVDRGHQVVVSCQGEVDVEAGDDARFIEYEDASEEEILSCEIWEDETEYSRGHYIDLDEIEVIGYESPGILTTISNSPLAVPAFYGIVILLILICSFFPTSPSPKQISKYLKNNSKYTYVTSITGKQRQKADVYKYVHNYVETDKVAKDIINGIEGETESVSQNGDEDSEIAIVTKKEYCLIYHPESQPENVYVQISKRKYNYTSDNEPYHSSSKTYHWYRRHYYSSGYQNDSRSFGKVPSAYSDYSGDAVSDVGDSYLDTYSHSVRQNSINNRKSSGGGVSSGK